MRTLRRVLVTNWSATRSCFDTVGAPRIPWCVHRLPNACETRMKASRRSDEARESCTAFVGIYALPFVDRAGAAADDPKQAVPACSATGF